MENWDQIDIPTWKKEHPEEYAEILKEAEEDKKECDRMLAEKRKALYEVIKRRRNGETNN